MQVVHTLHTSSQLLPYPPARCFDFTLSLLVAVNAAATEAAANAAEAKLAAARAVLEAEQAKDDLKRARADAEAELKQAQTDATTKLNRAKAEVEQEKCRNRAREKLQESNSISKLRAAQVNAAAIQAQVKSFSSFAAAAEGRAKAAGGCFNNTNSLLAQQLAENSQLLQEWPERESVFAHQLEAKSKELDGAKAQLGDQAHCFKQTMRNTVRVAQSKIVTSELRANEIVVSCKEDSRHTIVAFQESLERDYKQKEKQLRATDSTQILAVAKMKQDIVTVNKLTGPNEIQNSSSLWSDGI